MRLKNPLTAKAAHNFAMPGEIGRQAGAYEAALQAGMELIERPHQAPAAAIARQHQKGRMTVWERIEQLVDEPPTVLFQNWGENLDGASLVTAIGKVAGRTVAIYGHDFTVRAGSMDATNGSKLAQLFETAGKLRIPVVGFNDSAGAYVPAGVGGLDGYAEAFKALRDISGIVPSIMCMFGFNAGGGSYLPRQGSFIIQPKNTFFGLTGPGVVKSVLGEDVSADELGGPAVHAHTGVTDFIVEDEVAAIRKVRRILRYLPSHNAELAPAQPTSDPIDRATWEADILFKKAFNGPNGFNTPLEIGILVQQLCDHGDYLEIQPDRAANTLCALGRMGGQVIGFVANNSAVNSGQIDIEAAYKNARFIRFCNLYNIPMLFVEDTTGFKPGTEQEHGGVVQAGRAMLDAIIDLRTPRFLLIVRNAFGGAYASFNNYKLGADRVFALPTTRLAVMGPAGKTFVYKTELKAAQAEAKRLHAATLASQLEDGVAIDTAQAEAERVAGAHLAQVEVELSARYERELMNPREALSLGSISQLVMPKDMRATIGNEMLRYIAHYQPTAMSGTQREFH
ncbi:acetyl-CoA carboxylase carboxyltransferase subunit [Litorivicinus lipolyticus]|uniref:Acetyl-CoA carboxylase carboxyltransferase subunit n=1 Tax=Litorivicinus lipolyticus TaxID=418701 RepID=A0A5Q2QC22_9GAMM|nr:carboxyl transferase domain-containing protein [Litorivicinus lipolyticus]QGG79861.1 acetyl-CoA carboxylase carboxyltransferase subunit [Litorivicinus lipolyticus]